MALNIKGGRPSEVAVALRGLLEEACSNVLSNIGRRLNAVCLYRGW